MLEHPTDTAQVKIHISDLKSVSSIYSIKYCGNSIVLQQAQAKEHSRSNENG